MKKYRKRRDLQKEDNWSFARVESWLDDPSVAAMNRNQKIYAVWFPYVDEYTTENAEMLRV